MNSIAQKVSIVAVVAMLAATNVLAAPTVLAEPTLLAKNHSSTCRFVFEHSAEGGVNRILTKYDFLGIKVTGSSYEQLKPTVDLFNQEIIGTKIQLSRGSHNITTSAGVTPPEVHHDQNNSTYVKGDGWSAELGVDKSYIFSFGDIVKIVVDSTCHASVVPGKV